MDEIGTWETKAWLCPVGSVELCQEMEGARSLNPAASSLFGSNVVFPWACCKSRKGQLLEVEFCDHLLAQSQVHIFIFVFTRGYAAFVNFIYQHVFALLCGEPWLRSLLNSVVHLSALISTAEAATCCRPGTRRPLG